MSWAKCRSMSSGPLLRFLDTRGEYQRLGDPRPRRADVQVVCATNVPLDDPSYRNGRFREDLWYRLAAAVVHVPRCASAQKTSWRS